MTQILYIAGSGRSGSTLVGRLLGELPGFAYVGEVRYLFTHGFLEDEACGCGKQFTDCEFWQHVAACGRLDPGRARRAAETAWIHRRRYLPHLLLPSLRGDRYAGAVADYAGAFLDAYRAILEVSRATVIVDSSHSPLHPLLLRGARDLEFAVIHLVRDSRAVSYSWTRRRTQPRSVVRPWMPMHSPRSSATAWTLQNALIELTKRSYTRFIRIRYEDLCERPGATLAAAAEHLGFGRPELPDDGNVFHIGTHHTVVGNPNRFQTGELRIELDEGWRSAMRPADRRLVTAMTSPLLLHYGYGLRVHA